MTKEFKLGQTVKYVRIKPKDATNPQAELIHGEGVIVGHIIGVSKRENYMVKEAGTAFNLDAFAINPTPAEASQYLEHHKKIQKIVDDHNAHVESQITMVNKLIDEHNAEMFGPPVI